MNGMLIDLAWLVAITYCLLMFVGPLISFEILSEKIATRLADKFRERGQDGR